MNSCPSSLPFTYLFCTILLFSGFSPSLCFNIPLSKQSTLAPRAPSSPTLRSAAASRGAWLVGAAVNLRCLTNASEPIYSQLYAQQFNAGTAENECKWSATQPQQGVFAFDGCDAVKAAVASSGGVFRLHNLAWGQYNPDWLLKVLLWCVVLISDVPRTTHD